MSNKSRPSPVCLFALFAAVIGFLLGLTVIRSESALVSVVALLLAVPGVLIAWVCGARRIYRILSRHDSDDR